MSENQEDFDPEYQRGRTSVEHRNIDQAGADHPFGEEPRSFEADLRHLIRKVADDLYETWEATAREYLANAETATLKVEEYLEDPSSLPYDNVIVDDNYEPKVEVTWDRREENLIIKDNGIGMAAKEVDEIFRQIGHSAARDDGTKSGQFGMGALSFVKLVGLDNAMIMTSHSRLNDDNASYYVTLAGVEPIRGQLADDEYGTKFQMTPKEDGLDIRNAIEKYAEWMRVPVIYREMDENGQEVFNEDWGDKALYEDYDENRVCLGMREPNAFEAYCSPEANARTLLLSMDINRNDGDYSPGQHGAPFPFDVRILDESGKVIKSSNGNEGLMPCPRSDYESMLVEARDPYIVEDLLNNGDIIGQEIEAGPHEGQTVVADEVLDSAKPLPPGDYVRKSDLSEDDEPGTAEVLIGPNQGKMLVSEDEWNEMDEGRAGLYVPEDELQKFNPETGQGDLTLPEPTSDRDRLQKHETFWEYVGQNFTKQFDEKVDEVYQMIEDADDPLEAIMDLDPENLSLARRGIRELPTGRSKDIDTRISEKYGTDVSESTAHLINRIYKADNPEALFPAVKNAGLDEGVLPTDLRFFDGMSADDDIDIGNVLSVLDDNIKYGLAPRGDTSASKKHSRSTVYVPTLINSTHPDGDVYMAKSTGGAFIKKAKIAWDLHDDNEVVVVDDYDKWSQLLGWKQLKDFPHGKIKIREELGDQLSDDVLEDVAPEADEDDDDDDSTDSTRSRGRGQTKPKDKVLNIATGSRHRDRNKMSAGNLRSKWEDGEEPGLSYYDITKLVLFPNDTDRNLTDHWWIAGKLENSYPSDKVAIANCNNGTYEYLKDLDGIFHIDDYIDQSSNYVIDTHVGPTTVPRAGGSLVIHILGDEAHDRFTKKTVMETMPLVVGDYVREKQYNPPEFPEPDKMMYAPIEEEDVFFLRPILRETAMDDTVDSPVVLKGAAQGRDLISTTNCSSDFKLYLRARLPDWDYDSTEFEVLDDCSYKINLDYGGYELVETLGKLHDLGEKQFSEDESLTPAFEQMVEPDAL